jgi:hypothetical protein
MTLGAGKAGLARDADGSIDTTAAAAAAAQVSGSHDQGVPPRMGRAYERTPPQPIRATTQFHGAGASVGLEICSIVRPMKSDGDD